MSRSISVSRKAGLSEERGIVGTERVKPNWGCPAKKDLTIADFKPVGESSRYSMKQEACKTDARSLVRLGSSLKHLFHMDYNEWEPIYEEILADFGFSREEDERAARILSGMLGEKSTDLTPLRELISGKDVLVCGNGPSLDKELEKIEFEKYIIIAADGATSGLLQKGKVPHIIVTDLDGKVGDEIEANRRGAIMVVHAHGDNIGALLRFVPKLKNVLGTTQAEPIEKLHNFGGFTDGDRCVFLAKALGARSITLVGFDFEDPKVGAIKRKKLGWAKKLIGLALGSRA